MKIPFFQVDAFSNKAFGGNPAAICILHSWLDDDLLQKIAAENNVSETAFLVPTSPGNSELKWFTPTVEVDLCGHATLASAFVLFEYFDQGKTVLTFISNNKWRFISNKIRKNAFHEFPCKTTS